MANSSVSVSDPAPGRHLSPRARLLPGLALAAVLTALAWQLGHWLPLVGGPVFGIVLGVAVRNCLPIPAVCEAGIGFAGRQILQWSVVALGFGLGLDQVAQVGLQSLAVTLVTVTFAFGTAWALGRWLGIPGRLKLLIGAGTAICGGSAIAAITPIIDADEHETAFAISTIFLFNLIAVLLFPLLGHLLHMSDAGFGLWAGTAINDTSSVVAAGYSYSTAAGDYATIVKLTRATLIIPVCLGITLIQLWRSKHGGGSSMRLRQVFPWFIAWFVLASTARTLGWVPAAWLGSIHLLAEVLIILALTGVGLSADLRRMLVTGIKPILLGLATWAAVAVSSLVVQAVLGQL